MYETRSAWCRHSSPPPSFGSRSPTISLRKVLLPAPLAPTSTTRAPRVTVALAFERMSLSVFSYLKLTSLSVMTGLRKVRMPSGLPGSGKRMGSTCVVSEDGESASMVA